MRRQTCSCGKIEGRTTILNNRAHVGITAELHDNGVFKSNKAIYLKNNFCSQCGAPYEEDRKGERVY